MKVLHKVAGEEITVVLESAILNSTLPPEDTPCMEQLDIDDAKEDARKIAMELKSKCCGAEVHLKKGHLARLH